MAIAVLDESEITELIRKAVALATTDLLDELERSRRKRWWRALRNAKIEGYRFHDLRREFASELIRRNVNPNIVQKLFAHSDMSITNVYMQSDAAALSAAVNSLDSEIQNSEVIQ